MEVGTVTCSSCGATAPAIAKFCPSCGAPTATAQETRRGTPLREQSVPNPAGNASGTRTFNFKAELLTTRDRIVCGLSVAVMISVFLPWFSILGLSISGTSWHGYLWVSFLASAVVVAELVLRVGLTPQHLPASQHRFVLLGATGLSALLIVIGFISKPTGTDWSFGAIIAILAACGAVAVEVIDFRNEKAR